MLSGDEVTAAQLMRRAAPVVVNPIPDQLVFPGQQFNLTIDTYEVFNDSDGDPIVVSATRSDNSSLPEWLGFGLLELGSVILPGAGNRATIAGNYAFVTDEIQGLQIIDITDPNTATIVGSVLTPGLAKSVAVSNGYAYVADELRGLQVVDVTTPESLSLIKELTTPGEINDVKIVDEIAYLAAGSAGLQIANITIPGNITIIGNIDTGGNSQGLDIIDSYAYVADGLTGLQVFNVTDVTSPSILRLVPTPGFARDVAIAGNYAYIADDNAGLQVLDATDLANPVIETNVATTGWARTVKVQDNILYLAEFSNGLTLYSLIEPTDPKLIEKFEIAGNAEGIALGDNVRLVSDRSGKVNLLNLNKRAFIGTPQESDAENIEIKITATTADFQATTTKFTLVVQGAPRLVTPLQDILLVEVGKLFNYTIPADTFSDPNDDVLTYTATTAEDNALPGWISFDGISGNFLGTPQVSDKGKISVKLTASDGYATSDLSYFIFHVGTFPTLMNPILDQVIYPGTNTLNLNLQGSEHFYSENGEITLIVKQNDGSNIPGWMQVTQPPLSLSGSYDTSDRAYGVTYSAPYAYVVDGNSGLRIIDVSNPAAPFEKGYYDTPGEARGVYYSAPYAYVADGSGGLRIIDVSNPAAPYEKGYYETGDAYGVYYAAPYAYVADKDAGLRIIDVSNPAAPYEKGYYDALGQAYGVYYAEPYAYVADYGAGLRIIDVSNPVAPFEKGYYGMPGFAYYVYYSAPYAYVCELDLDVGLHIIDVNNPAVPFEKGFFGGTAIGVYYSAPYAYVAGSGLHIIDVSNPAAPVGKGYYDTGYARGVYYSAPYAYVAAWFSGLQIIRTHFDEVTLEGSPTSNEIGNYELTVTATDPVGATVTDTFKLKVQGPPEPLNSIPMQSIDTEVAYDYTFADNVFTDPNDDVLTYTATLANDNLLPTWLNLDPSERRFYGTPQESDRGVYNIKVIADDGYGGTAATTFELDVGQKPVVANPIPDQVANIGVLYQYTFAEDTFMDPNYDTLTYLAGLSGGFDLPEWLGFTSGTRTFSGTPQEDDLDVYLVTVTADDSHGGIDADTFVLDVEHFPVLVNPIGTVYAGINRQFNFTIPGNTFTDADGDSLSFTATKLDNSELYTWLELDSGTGRFIGIPQLADYGNNPVNLTAHDGRGGTATDIFSIDVSHFPEVTNPIPNQLAHIDVPFTYTFPENTFTDEDGDSLIYTATLQDGNSLPDWLSFVPGTQTFSGTPRATDAITSWVKVTASDNKGTGSDVFELAVENNPPVVANPIPDQVVEINQEFVYDVPANTFSDPDGHSLNYNATLANNEQLPDWLVFTEETVHFAGTPTGAAESSYEIKVTAADSYGGSIDDEFTLVIERFPVLKNPIGLHYAKIAQAFSLVFVENTFTDADGDPLTYQAGLSNGDILPGWLSFYGGDRTFNGTAIEGDQGLLSIKVIAADPYGGTANDVFTIDVDHNPEVNLALEDQVVDVGEQFTYIFEEDSFVDVDGDSLTYRARLGDISNNSALPDWLKLDSQNRRFYGEPSAEEVGRIEIKVTADDGKQGYIANTFNLEVDHFPKVAEDIELQHAKIGDVFNYTMPLNTFYDADGDSLTFTVLQANKQPIPSWLNFTNDRDFIGTATEIAYGLLNVEVTAHDGKGGTGSHSFKIKVDHNPEVALPLPNRVAKVGQALNFFIDQRAFTDVDGDSLTYRASLADGSELPEWLGFNPLSGTFAGVPRAIDAGLLAVEVIANDGNAGSVADDFGIYIYEPISDQIAKRGVKFSYKLDDNAFAGINNIMSYSAGLINGNELPSWLYFDATELRFTGEVPANLTGEYQVEVLAHTSTGETYSVKFFLSLEINKTPEVINRISNQVATVDQAFSFVIPGDTFRDLDGDELSYSAQAIGEEEWPTWLRFNKATRTFSGTPSRSDTNLLNTLTSRVIPLEVRASDTVGSGETTFSITVEGQSWLESGLQVGSAAATVFAVYRNRSLFLNRARDLRGRKTDEAIIGKRYSRRLTISEKNIRLVKTQVRRKSVPLSCGNRFFCGRWPYIDLPEGGEFPRWLKYDPRTCMLSGTPQAGDERDFIVQVIGSGGVIKEWFELTVRASELEESAVIDIGAETTFEADASMTSLPVTEGVTGAGAASSTAQLLTQSGLFGSEGQQGSAQDIAEVEMEPISVDTPAAAVTAQPAPKSTGS